MKDANGYPALYVPVAVATDFDRCFGDTEAYQKLTEQVTAENTTLTVRQIHEARHYREKVEGKSFGTVAYIRQALLDAGEGHTWAEHIKPELLERARVREDLFVKNGRAVLDLADRHGMPTFTMTHGHVLPPHGRQEREDAYEWQATKVVGTAPLNERPYYVSYEPSKGKTFGSWYSEANNGFLLPRHITSPDGLRIIARSLLLIDDKISSYRHWPEQHAYGIQVIPEDPKNRRPSQIGELSREQGLYQVIGMGQAGITLEMMIHNELAKYYDLAA